MSGPSSLKLRDSADALAFRMAGYVTDPKYIAAYVAREYGEHKRPDIKTVRAFQEQRRRQKEAFERERSLKACNYNPDNDNGEPFRVAGLVKPRGKLAEHKKAAPTEVELATLRKVTVPWRPTGERIIHAVAEAFDITVEQLKGTSRARYYVVARAVAIRLLRDCKRGGARRFSTPQIAAMVGKRDHSTILHALETFDTWAMAYPDAREIYEHLKDLTRWEQEAA